MEWPFFRRSASSGTGDRPQSPVPAEEWSRLPPIQSILPPLEGTHGVTAFADRLATGRPLPLALARLEHLVSDIAPSGVIAALSFAGARRPRRVGRRSAAARSARRDDASIGSTRSAFEEEPSVEGPAPIGPAPATVPAAHQAQNRERQLAPAASSRPPEARPTVQLPAESARESATPALDPRTADSPAGGTRVRRPPVDDGPGEDGERGTARAAEPAREPPAEEPEALVIRRDAQALGPPAATEASEREPSRRRVPSEGALHVVPRRPRSALPAASILPANEGTGPDEMAEVTEGFDAPARFRLTAVARRPTEPLASSVVPSPRAPRRRVAGELMPAISESAGAARSFVGAPEDPYAASSAEPAAAPAVPSVGPALPGAPLSPTLLPPSSPPPPAAAAESVAQPLAAPADAAPSVVETPPADLETLADDLYEHVRARLTQELVLDRERTLFTPELR